MLVSMAGSSRASVAAIVFIAACASQGSDDIYSGNWDQVSVSFTCSAPCTIPPPLFNGVQTVDPNGDFHWQLCDYETGSISGSGAISGIVEGTSCTFAGQCTSKYNCVATFAPGCTCSKNTPYMLIMQR